MRMSKPRRMQRWIEGAGALLVIAGVMACSDLSGLAGSQQLPNGIPDPNTFNTPAGAIALYHMALYKFQAGTTVERDTTTMQQNPGAFVNYVLYSGLFADELEAWNFGTPGGTPALINTIDARQLPEGTTSAPPTYVALNAVRATAAEGIGALAAYAPEASPALRGQLYALQGYAEILLADLYCSGVPLSTFDFHGDFTYKASSTTAQVYQDAVAKFDTALALSADSSRIMNLARVGKGRALIDLGQYAEAAAAVASVPDDYAYQFDVDWTHGTYAVPVFQAMQMTVVDREGQNGFPYISSGDPRTQTASSPSVVQHGQLLYAPVKYGGTTGGVLPITVASGIEARLIEAEAALHANDVTTWRNKLNALRSAGTPALPAIDDPGTAAARVDTLFHERAAWLFLTGERQGDVRRLIRQYGRTEPTVYPTGAYRGYYPTYGPYVNVPIDPAESANPLFHGCLDRGA